MRTPELPIDPPSERDCEFQYEFDHDDDCDCERCDERRGEAYFDAEEEAREADGEFRYESLKNGDYET